MNTERYARQSFLGPDAEARIAACTVGIVGLGGGGSHIVQQLAHVGFQRYVIFDNDIAEESNLNRLVGATSVDVSCHAHKIDIATRMILGLQPNAEIEPFFSRWQEKPEPLRKCQIVFGGVDSYKGRYELEVACRRYLTNYIDIGMDVHGDDKPVIGGQIILSSPGGPCMWCMGFLTDDKLGQEAARYGNVGPRPQVVWPNGALASTAVGFAVDLVTNWTRRAKPYAFLVYNGNESTIQESLTLRGFKGASCLHFPLNDVGDPILIEL